ncbi:MAG: RES domain-containing protein [Acetobacteraceae bacterium]|nr:RES domain-containing protein [Acetobacteraceae bacterium]
MRLWRLAGIAFPLWSGDGARLKGGRWNQKGTPAIYTACSFAMGVLEVIVHANIGRVPRGINFIAIDIPDDVPIDHVNPADLPGWDANPPDAAQRYGTAWLKRCQGLVLLVPAAVTSGLDRNAVINPLHPAIARVRVGAEEPVRLNPRLFPERA